MVLGSRSRELTSSRVPYTVYAWRGRPGRGQGRGESERKNRSSLSLLTSGWKEQGHKWTEGRETEE